MHRTPLFQTTITIQTRMTLRPIIGLVLIFLAGCSPSPDLDNQTIASYRDGSVTAEDLDRWLTLRKLKDQPYDLGHEVNQIVLTRTLVESARAGGRDRDPAIAQKLELAEIAILERTLHRHLAASVTVTDAEIDALYASQPGAFSKPLRVRLYNLYKRFPPGASSDERSRIRRRMNELRKTLVDGVDFSETVLAESDSETRYRGGRMGTFEEGELPPAINSIVMEMVEGEISQVLETQDGLTILKCGGVFEAKKPEAIEIRSKIETNLLRNRRQTKVEEHREETLASSNLVIEMSRVLDPACPPDEVIATFSDHEVTRLQLTSLAAARQASRRQAGMNESRARSILEHYAVTSLAAARALELGLENESLKSEIRGRQELILATEELGLRVRDRLQEPTREEIAEYFTTHRSEFRHPEEIDLMVIEMTFTEESLTERHAEARAALDALKSGAISFEEAMRRYSEVPVADDTPIMTLTTRQLASYGASVGNAVRILQPDSISGLIRQGNRLFIVKLVNRRQSQMLDFEAAERRVRNRVGQIRADEATAQIEAEILDQAQVVLSTG